MGLILITGGRTWPHIKVIRETLQQLRASEKPWLAIVHGDCPTGTDRICRDLCEDMGLCEFRCPAKWVSYGRRAGMMRNEWMLRIKPDCVMAFHTDLASSKGTKGMVDLAVKAKIECHHHNGIKWKTLHA